MPFLRYFLYVGSALVALMFVADWVWPSAPSTVVQQAATETPVQQSIRIHSERRWPDRIEFDTTQPIAAPSPEPVVVAEPAPAAPASPAVAASSPLDARAEIKPTEIKPAVQPAPRRQARVVHHHNRRPPPDSTWAYAPMAPSWSFRW